MSKVLKPRKGRFSLRFTLSLFGSLFFLASWLIPNHYPPWVGFHNEALMFSALLMFCAHAVTFSNSVRLPQSTLLIFTCLILIIIFQWIGGLIFYGGDALVSCIFVAGFALSWWLGAHNVLVLRRPEIAVAVAAWLIVSAACVSSLLAILQWLSLEQGLLFFVAERGSNRPYANLAQPNLLATLLVMGVVFVNFLYLRKMITTWQVLVILIFLSFGLVVTESRAGLLSTFCIGFFSIMRIRPGWKVNAWRSVAVWWGVLITLIGFWGPLNEILLLRSPRQSDIAVDNVRMVIWEQVIVGILQAPWLGYGWRQTVMAQKFGAEGVPGNFPTDYAHSIVLDLLAWVGLPVGLLLLSIGFWWIWRTIANIKDSTEFLLVLATIPVLVHSLVEFPFAYAYFLFPTAWIFGFLHASQFPLGFRVRTPTPISTRITWPAILLLFGILCGQIVAEYFEAEEDFRVMRFEMRNLGSRSATYEAPQLRLLTQLDDLLKMGRVIPTRHMSAAEIEALRKANLSKHWGALNLKYAIALGLNGRPEEAKIELRIIESLYGPTEFHSALVELRALQDEKYPELSQIKLDR